MRAVLEEGSYRVAAQHLALAMRRVDGVAVAADVIESALGIGATATATESGLVSAGNVRLRDELRESNAGEDEESRGRFIKAGDEREDDFAVDG